MKKFLKVLLIIILVLVAIVALVLLGGMAYFKISNADYFNNSERQIKIPDIHNGFIPQGLSYDENSNTLLLGGYTNNGKNSPIYVISLDNNEVKKVNLNKQDGSAFKGHAGGLQVHNNYVYVAGSTSGLVYVYSYEDILNVQNNGYVNCLGEVSFKTDNDKMRVSFVTEIEGNFAIGEYYAPGYSTNESHHYGNSFGIEQGALLVLFKYDENSEFGLSNEPIKAYSIPNNIQGATSKDGTLFLTASSGPTRSKMYTFDLTGIENAKNTTVNTILDKEIDITILDNNYVSKITEFQPMGEEVVIIDDKVFVACESASNAYYFGNLYGAQYLYATKLSYFK